ncbi:MAG: sulfite exporter TauE/SafE family protein [Rhizobiales bacterium]|nr:sulfite exporter TauE/SafE family protein [Hyphomicrobiales bacterium]
MLSLYLVVAAGAVVAGFVQGISGFGFGLVAMSLWAWVLEPRLAAALIVFASLIGQFLTAHTLRRGFEARLLAPYLLGGLAGIPLGVMALPHLDMVTFRALLGGLLAVWCPAMLLARRIPHIRGGGRIADGLTGLAGGVLGGLGGFTGVIPALWCTLRGYPKHTQRTIIQSFNLSMLLVTMISYLVAGIVTADMLPFFAVVVPALLLPTLIGARLYAVMSEARFRQLILGLLAASGMALLGSAAFELLAR